MLVVLLGAPGAGKGTQADILTERNGLTHVSSGDLLRMHRQQKTELGQLAQSYMDRGDLVPDDVVIRMVLDKLSEETDGPGVVLDGFPRTAPQAKALDEALGGSGIDVVLHVKVPEDELVRRLSNRYICRGCSRPYTAESMGKACESCGGELYQREDDMPEAVRNRLQVYANQTYPLIDYYEGKGKLVEVNGLQDVDAVTADVMEALAH
ncbi:MAG: adenylate kinase [Chloroflexota bacterium]|nr:adenylate kinase [Chloroflexota bacterium]MDE2968564.1 adenylate kinase [Chloroflexota bacterium]